MGVLDADAPRVRDGARSRPRRVLRLRRNRCRRNRRARYLSRGAASNRESARRGRPYLDRERDAAHGGPRGARRRLLRAQRDVRALGRVGPDRALSKLAARERGHDRRGGGRDRSGGEEDSQRRAQARGRVAPPRTLAAHGGRVRNARRPRHAPSQVMAELTYLQAISDGLRTEMRRDKRVFVIGEDVGVYGGAFKVTLGFQEEFGHWRVMDAPLSETAIVGSCTGAAIMGMRPVAAKQRYRAGTAVPLVVRLPSGGGFSGGPFHSQNPESSFAHIPGLKCVCPATPEDAKGLL